MGALGHFAPHSELSTKCLHALGAPFPKHAWSESGVAKGADRKPGLERFVVDGKEIGMSAVSAAGHLIQHIRDEAHRFAITGHRQRRNKARTQSELDDIAGIGPKRRKELLTHFGGLRGVKGASVDELAKVPGVSGKLANDIYQALHG